MPYSALCNQSILMAAKRNRFGLSRSIPADIKRQVRQECGFGCVLCGRAIVEYEHFAPPFEHAIKHDAAGIALLCGHCHRKRTAGVIAVSTVATARLVPECLRVGYVRGDWDLSPPFDLWIGSSIFRDVRSIVSTREGEHWFSIGEPECIGGPPEITAQFFDCNGDLSLSIDRNEWESLTDNWDIDTVGPRTTIRSGAGMIALQIKTVPPHCLILERLNMRRHELGVAVTPSGKATITRGSLTISLEQCSFQQAESVLVI